MRRFALSLLPCLVERYSPTSDPKSIAAVDALDWMLYNKESPSIQKRLLGNRGTNMTIRSRHFFSDRYEDTVKAVQNALGQLPRSAFVSVSESNSEGFCNATVWFDDSGVDSEILNALENMSADVREPDPVTIERHRGESLEPDDNLLAGDYLQSWDGRFRLYLTENGSLRAYMYLIDQEDGANKRVQIYPVRPDNNRDWPIDAGPNSRLRLPRDSPFSGAFKLTLLDSDGRVVWQPIPNFSGRGSSSRDFVVQSDGNLVHRLHNTDRAFWASGSDARARSHELHKAVAPNCEVLNVEAGRLAISIGGPSNADIINNTNTTICVRDGENYQAIMPNESVQAASIAGTLQVVSKSYKFNSSLDDGSSDYRSSVDAVRTGNSITKEGSADTRIRVTVTTGGSGLRLT